MTMRSLLVAVSIAATLSTEASAQDAPSPPSGESPSPNPTPALEEGQRGLVFYSESRWQDAYESFSRAEASTHSPVFLLYMARSLTHLGRLLEAAALYRRVLEEDTSGAPQPWKQARLDAGAELTALRERIPVIEIRTAGTPATLTVDGRPAKANTRIELDPGSHEIVHGRQGRVAKKSITVKPGDALATISFDDDGSAPLGRRRDEGAPPAVIAGGVFLGVGVASLVAGAITGAVALKLAADVHEVCVEGTPCPVPQSSLQPDIDEARRYGDATTGLLVAGSVLSVTGLVLVLARPGAPRSAATAPSAYLLPAGPGIVIGGSF